MFGAIQRSRSLSQPIFLYDIRYGEDAFLHLSNAEVPGQASAGKWGGETIWPTPVEYQPAVIRHGEIETSGTLDNSTLEVRTSLDSPLLQLFKDRPVSQITWLRISLLELRDFSGGRPIWNGRILSFGVDGNEAKFVCEPQGTGIRRPGLRRNYQIGCPHVLYGPVCRADKSAATTVVAAEGVIRVPVKTSETSPAVNTPLLVLPSGWAGGPVDGSEFTGGSVEHDVAGVGVETRNILYPAFRDATAPHGWRFGPAADPASHPCEGFLLSGDLEDLEAGTSVRLVLGCNHQLDQCTGRHANAINYGGQPWIPTTNPVGSHNSFY